MNIETGKTPTEQDYLSFKNKYNEKITLVAGEESLRCAIREDGDTSMHAPFTHFTRDEVKAILPYLQAYAETGTFEPTQMLSLQGVEEKIAMDAVINDPAKRIDALLELFQDQGERIASLEGDLAQAVEHINALEQLARDWRQHWLSPFGSKAPDELVHLTEQLLREDH